MPVPCLVADTALAACGDEVRAAGRRQVDSGVADIPSARQGFARGFGRPGVAEGFFGVRPPGAAAGQHCGGGTNPPVGVALVVIVSQCQTGCKQHHERVLTELSIKF